jgi:hypothetical protein
LSLGRRLAFVILLGFSASVARADQAGPPDDSLGPCFQLWQGAPAMRPLGRRLPHLRCGRVFEDQHCMPAERNPLSARYDKTARDRRRQP